MTIKFKIFLLEYQVVETFGGYSDGYGKEHVNHPVFKAAKFPPLCWDEYDTEPEAIEAIEKYGSNWSEYVIQKVYSK